MSLESIHLQQARHNKDLAIHLFSHHHYKDWAVTACFYSAVHLAEALFFRIKPSIVFSGINYPNIEHSDRTVPPRQRSLPSPGYHGWREILIQEIPKQSKITKDFWKIYKNLHDQSNISRYLFMQKTKTSIDKLAYDFFSDSDILDFIDKDLDSLEKEANLCGVSLPSRSRFNIIILIKNLLIFFKSRLLKN